MVVDWMDIIKHGKISYYYRNRSPILLVILITSQHPTMLILLHKYLRDPIDLFLHIVAIFLVSSPAMNVVDENGVHLAEEGKFSLQQFVDFMREVRSICD